MLKEIFIPFLSFSLGVMTTLGFTKEPHHMVPDNVKSSYEETIEKNIEIAKSERKKVLKKLKTSWFWVYEVRKQRWNNEDEIIIQAVDSNSEDEAKEISLLYFSKEKASEELIKKNPPPNEDPWIAQGCSGGKIYRPSKEYKLWKEKYDLGMKPWNDKASNMAKKYHNPDPLTFSLRSFKLKNGGYKVGDIFKGFPENLEPIGYLADGIE